MCEASLRSSDALPPAIAAAARALKTARGGDGGAAPAPAPAVVELSLSLSLPLAGGAAVAVPQDAARVAKLAAALQEAADAALALADCV